MAGSTLRNRSTTVAAVPSGAVERANGYIESGRRSRRRQAERDADADRCAVANWVEAGGRLSSFHADKFGRVPNLIREHAVDEDCELIRACLPHDASTPGRYVHGLAYGSRDAPLHLIAVPLSGGRAD